MTDANRHNWLTETARELNGQIYQHRKSQPTEALRARWHQDYLDSGAQYRQSWVDYCRGRTNAWYQQQELLGWTFGTGKFKGKRIATTIKRNIGYIEWVLENQPQGKTAKQIIHFISRYPAILDQVKRRKA